MFTGIVQGTGEIVSAKDHNALRTIQIEFPAGFMDGIAIGASVSLDGTCLTVTEILSPTRLSFDVIQQTTGSGHDDVHASFECLVLFAVTDAAEDDRDRQVGEPREIPDGRLDLCSEFARGFEDEQAGVWLMGFEFGKDGQSERSGLARAGLRAADDVAPFDDERDGAELDGGGIHVAHRFHTFEKFGRQT